MSEWGVILGIVIIYAALWGGAIWLVVWLLRPAVNIIRTGIKKSLIEIIKTAIKESK